MAISELGFALAAAVNPIMNLGVRLVEVTVGLVEDLEFLLVPGKAQFIAMPPLFYFFSHSG